MEKISVAVRVKPVIESNITQSNQWKVTDNTIALYNVLDVPVPGHSYTFDRVFDMEANNKGVYEAHTKELILSTLQGFNGTVFAYGQTSSGKTYTMHGTETDPGIINRAVHDIFNNTKLISDREFLIRVSYMEIYKEEIIDLLAPENRKLRIHENVERGTFVAGLREEIVNCPEQVLEFLKSGEAHRHIGETNMNTHSSRSHTIFRMVIESTDRVKEGDDASKAVRVSALNMVDLAGSERIAKTRAGGIRLKEGTLINKSLMTLGTVINKLSEASVKQGGHIPYRDSKLTRILQPALDGNAKTAIICNITTGEVHLDETRGTLNFASRAKKVTTCAQVNETVSGAALLKRQKKEIEELRQKLQQDGTRSDDLEKEILNLRNDLLKFELEKERLMLELEEEKKTQAERELRIKEQEKQIQNLSSMVQWDDGEQCLRMPNKAFDIDENELAEFIPNSLVSMRRERTLTPPPAFDRLFEDEYDTFWSPSSRLDDDFAHVEDISVSSEFENVADEDTWINLNRGQLSFDSCFSSLELWGNPRTSDMHRLGKVEYQLKEMQGLYNELMKRFKSQEEDSSKTRMHLEELLKERDTLKDEFICQLKLQGELEKAFTELENEVAAERALTSSLQEALKESQEYQLWMHSRLQDIISSGQVCEEDMFIPTRPLQCVIHNKELSSEHASKVISNCLNIVDIDECKKLEEVFENEQMSKEQLFPSATCSVSTVHSLYSCPSVTPNKRSSAEKVKGSSRLRRSSLYFRISELEETDKHLRELLQQSMSKLLEYQNTNQELIDENTSLLHANVKFQTAIDGLKAKIEILNGRLKEADDDMLTTTTSVSALIEDYPVNDNYPVNDTNSFFIHLQWLLEELYRTKCLPCWSGNLISHQNTCSFLGKPRLALMEGVRAAEIIKDTTVQYCQNLSLPVSINHIWRMTEIESCLAFSLLKQIERIKVLERDLAAAELEVVELKVEVEDLRRKIQFTDIAPHGVDSGNKELDELESANKEEMEVHALRYECEKYRQEIRMILKQVPTAEDELAKNTFIKEVSDENYLLQKSLVKAEKQLLRERALRNDSKRLCNFDCPPLAQDSSVVLHIESRPPRLYSSSKRHLFIKGTHSLGKEQGFSKIMPVMPCKIRAGGSSKQMKEGVLKDLDANVGSSPVFHIPKKARLQHCKRTHSEKENFQNKGLRETKLTFSRGL